ncbi:MAG: OmpA family protein [Lysobacteraceae bacterium]
MAASLIAPSVEVRFMIRNALWPLAGLFLLAALPAAASEDCKPHSLFTPMPGYHIYECDSSDFDAKDIPVGVNEDGEVVLKTIEGVYEMVAYEIDEGASAASPLKILRNHIAAATAKGGSVVWEHGGSNWMMAGEWSNMQQRIATLKLSQGGRDYWVHLGSVNDGDYYAIASISAEAMEQVVSVNELLAQFDKDGFLELEVHFDTARATIRPESSAVLDQAAAMLREASSASVEVAGHTDNVGDAAANQSLSEQRAASVRQALVERGIDAARLSAKGYGASQPVADNRSEEGRAKNRRVELVKR